MKKFLFIVSLLTIALLALPGCSGDSTPETPTELDTVRYGNRMTADLLPIYVAIEQGYFLDNGIDMQLVPIQSSSLAMKALSTGELDAGIMAFEILTQAREQDIDVFMIASYSYKPLGSDCKAFVVHKDSPYYELADLEGKIIGGYTKNICPWFHTMAALDEAGLSETDYEYKELYPAQMAVGLQEGTIDAAAYLADPYLTMVEDDIRVLFYWDNYNAPCPCGHAFTGDMIRNNRDVVERWVDAMQQGITFIHEHNEEARLIMAQYLEVDEDLALVCALPGWDDNGCLFEDMAEKQLVWMQKYGIIETIPDVDDLYDYSFTGKAYALELQ